MSRMTWVAFAAALAVAGYAETASAYIPLNVFRDYDKERTEFFVSVCDEPCNATAEVYWRDKRVFSEDLIWTDESYYDQYDGFNDYQGFYYWSCRHVGSLRWKVTVSDADSEGEETEEGTLRLGACGKTRPRRVGRGTAARKAASRYDEDEYVSRSTCTALDGGSKASKWRCVVVHNNNYRQCESTLRLRFVKQSRFGKTKVSTQYGSARNRCRSF